MSEVNIKNMDCFEYLETIPDDSIDCAIIDPPYGVLGKHKIETGIDIPKLTALIYKKLKKDAFYCIFGQMPTLNNWINETLKLFAFQDHITWAKRMQTAIYLQIVRSHEDIIIFKKGNPKFYKTKQDFADFRIPMLPLGLVQLQSIERTNSFLKQLQNAIIEGKSNEELKAIIYDKRKNKKNNDAIHSKMNANAKDRKTIRFPTDRNVGNTWAFELSEKEYHTVWSFASENQSNYGKNGSNFKHPTVKPIKLLECLIELCVPEKATVLDCFLGSGTTAVAAINTNRNFAGCELDKDYYEMSRKRADNATENNKYKQGLLYE